MRKNPHNFPHVCVARGLNADYMPFPDDISGVKNLYARIDFVYTRPIAAYSRHIRANTCLTSTPFVPWAEGEIPEMPGGCLEPAVSFLILLFQRGFLGMEGGVNLVY